MSKWMCFAGCVCSYTEFVLETILSSQLSMFHHSDCRLMRSVGVFINGFEFCGQFFFFFFSPLVMSSPLSSLTAPFCLRPWQQLKISQVQPQVNIFCWCADIIIARQGAVMWLVEWWDGLRQLTSSIA